MNDDCKYNIPINILTPIHIGSIDKYYANEYLFNKDKVYRINLVDFFNSLNSRNQEKFIKRIQDVDFSLSDLEYIDVDLLKSFSRYSLINKCSSFPKNNNVEIECGVRTQNKLFIPGSSIKGSIKTALLYNAIEISQIPDIITKILLKNNHNFIQDYFTSSLENSTIFNNYILRFLQIEDSSNFVGVPHLHQVVSWYIEDDKKSLSPRYYETRYMETIPPSDNLQTVITVNYEKKFYEELNFDEETEEFLNIDKISESLASFAKDFIDFEINFFSEFHRQDLVKFYKELKGYNCSEKPLILLGGANSIYSKTIYLKIHQYDKKHNTHYLENYSQLVFGTTDDSFFPKSRKLTYKNSKPLGWVQLDFSKYL